MGKLFKLIESDIIDLAFESNDRSDYTFVDYAKINLSESRITKLYQLIEDRYKDINPKKVPPKFPFENRRDYRSDIDRAKIELILDKIEEELGNDVDGIIDEVNKINKDIIAFDGKVYVENITKDTIMEQFNGALQTLEIAVKYSDIQNNKLVTKKDLLTSSKSYFSNILSKGLAKGVLEPNTEEYNKIKEYVDNPVKAFVKYNSNVFENEKEKVRFEKYLELDNKEALALENEDEFMDSIDFDGIDSSEDLASLIVESISQYNSKRNEYIQNHNENELPNLGRFMYDLKDKITEILPDSEIYLGNDENSKFVKDFLHNPIDGMTKYIDDKIKNINEIDLLRSKLIKDENTDVDFEKLKNNESRFKDIILRERDNYNDYSKDKIDVWHVRQDTNSKRFENLFKDKMNNVVIPQALKNNKGGFFENLFGTTSKEYKEFSKSLANMVEDGSEKGDLDGLRDKAEAYLSHKFKDYDPNTSNSIKEEDIAKLDSTSKGRVRLCLAVINSIDYTKKAEYRDLNPFDDKADINIFGEINKLNQKFEELDKFQNNLKIDSDIDKNNIIDNDLNSNNNIIENEFKK